MNMDEPEQDDTLETPETEEPEQEPERMPEEEAASDSASQDDDSGADGFQLTGGMCLLARPYWQYQDSWSTGCGSAGKQSSYFGSCSGIRMPKHFRMPITTC